MPDDKPSSEPPTDRTAQFLILLEEIRSQNRATIEASQASYQALETQMHEGFARQDARFDVLEAVVRGHNTELRIVNGRLDQLSGDMQGVRGDVQVLKSDVQVLKTDVQLLKEDVKEIRTDLRRVETKVDGLETRFDHLESRFDAREA